MSHNGFFEQKDQKSGGKSETQKDHLQSSGVRFHQVFPSLSDGLSDDDGGCVGAGHAEGGKKLENHRGDGVRGDGFGADMAQDRGLDRLRKAPQQTGDHDRQGDAHIVSQIAPVKADQIHRPHPQLFVEYQKVYQHGHQLHDPGGQRGVGRAPDAQLRRAEVTEDQGVVQTAVDDNGGAGHDHADEGGLNALEGVH